MTARRGPRAQAQDVLLFGRRISCLYPLFRVEVVAALSLSAPATRLPDERVVKIARRLIAAAHTISAQLGRDVAMPGTS